VTERRPILGLDLPELEDCLARIGESTYRAKQISHWLHRRGAKSFAEMTDLSEPLRARLESDYSITVPPVEEFTSGDGTRKFRFLVGPGEAVEAVWIPDENRKTLCVSSQVGCALGCRFCVTGAIGFRRNLRADEIVAQVRHVKLLEKLPVTNLVFMGMGEPLQNEEGVLAALRVLTSDHGLKIGRRKITVSTVGLVPRIAEFLRTSDVNLAVSITGTNDRERDRWMPINRKYPLKVLTDTLRAYPWKLGRKVTFEVVLIGGETDGEDQALELARWLRGIPCMVNLIPYNENPLFPELRAPDRERILAYQTALIRKGIRAMIRRSRGQDILAACGQLAGRTLEKSEKEKT
jgi:23S rRNA (adenine2503-C2)-methyltransferase